jgi:large subunit ribosomal protein L10
MATSEKTAAVAEIAEAFRGATAAVLTEYRGLTVAQITELRRAMGRETKYAVVKNTLTKLAAREAGVEGIDEHLTGPTAVAFITGDPVEATKGLRDFSRANPVLVIKGGVLDGKPLTADEIRRIADLESREVLLARMAGAMNGSLAKAVGLFAAPLSQVARLVEALRQQQESGAPAGDSAGDPAGDSAGDTAGDTA